MNSIKLIVLFSILISSASVFVFAEESDVKLLIPMYFFPSDGGENEEYHQVADLSKRITVVAIVRPTDGPNLEGSNPSWAQAFEFLKQSFLNSTTSSHVLGYIDTDNGVRNMKDVKSNVDAYASWPESYRPSGIFFDNADSSVEKLFYFQQLYSYVKEKFGASSRVFTNSKMSFIPDYLCSGQTEDDAEDDECSVGIRATDMGVFFEGSCNQWLMRELDTSIIDRHRYGIMVHSCPVKWLESALEKAVHGNVGFLYFTDVSKFKYRFTILPNSSYFDLTLDYIKKYSL